MPAWVTLLSRLRQVRRTRGRGRARRGREGRVSGGIEFEEANVPAQAVALTALDYLDWAPEKPRGATSVLQSGVPRPE